MAKGVGRPRKDKLAERGDPHCLLGVGEVDFLSLKVEKGNHPFADDILVVEAQCYGCEHARKEKSVCNGCVERKPRINEYDGPRILGHPSKLRLHIFRTACPRTPGWTPPPGVSVSDKREQWQPPPGIAEHWQATVSAVVEDILDCLYLPTEEVARRADHPSSRVARQFDAFAQAFHREYPPTAEVDMALDAAGYSRGAYTLIMGVFPKEVETWRRGYVIDVLEGEDSEIIGAFLANLPGAEIVQSVSIDESNSLRSNLHTYLPHARPTADRWHSLKNLFDGMASARYADRHAGPAEMMTITPSGKRRQTLRHLTNKQLVGVNDWDRATLFQMLENRPNTQFAYFIKEEISRFMARYSYEETSAPEFIDEVREHIVSYCNSIDRENPAYQYVGPFLRNLSNPWIEEVINHIIFKTSTGAVERRHRDVAKWDALASENLPFWHLRIRMRTLYGHHPPSVWRQVAERVAREQRPPESLRKARPRRAEGEHPPLVPDPPLAGPPSLDQLVRYVLFVSSRTFSPRELAREENICERVYTLTGRCGLDLMPKLGQVRQAITEAVSRGWLLPFGTPDGLDTMYVPSQEGVDEMLTPWPTS